MTTIYLIRHAEAEGNLYRRMHGQLDSMITPLGMKQIRLLAERFASVSVDACYSSDLIRTQTTAQAIFIPKHLPLQIDPSYRELDVGIWEDRTFGWLHYAEPEQMTCFSKDPVHWQVQGSEPFSSYTTRFITAMTAAAKRHDGQTFAIFSHAAVMRGVMMVLFPDVPVYPCDNTSVTKLTWEKGQYRLHMLNDNAHLPIDYSTLANNQRPIKGYSRTDNLFWYQEMKDGMITVMSGERPAGCIRLSAQDQQTGVLEHMELYPAWRGRGRAIQLLGEAVFYFRKQGMRYLVFQKPNSGCMDDLCERMELMPDCSSMCCMDIQPRILPLGLCTAGEPAGV